MPPVTRQRASRTPPAVRREQLITSAVGAFAARGYPDVELRDIAADVGVTPNLIHHYFPGGKAELYREAVRRACAELAGTLDTSDDVPLGRKMPSNIAAYLEHVLKPSPAYLLYARAARSANDDVRAAAVAMRRTIAAGVARNHLGTDAPPAPVHAALIGYIAFAEAAAEQWRDLEVQDRQRLERLLGATLVATVAAAVDG
jgi:AcrR family transcriptional regulator